MFIVNCIWNKRCQLQGLAMWSVTMNGNTGFPLVHKQTLVNNSRLTMALSNTVHCLNVAFESSLWILQKTFESLVEWTLKNWYKLPFYFVIFSQTTMQPMGQTFTALNKWAFLPGGANVENPLKLGTYFSFFHPLKYWWKNKWKIHNKMNLYSFIFGEIIYVF